MDYREAGVDISAADAAKARIKGLARATFNAQVLTEIGSFGGCSARPLPLPRAGARGLDGRRRHQDQGGDPGRRPRHGGLRPRRPLRERHPRAGRARSSSSTTWPSEDRPGRVERSSRASPAPAPSWLPLIGGDRRDAGRLRHDDYDLAGFIVGVVEKTKALPRGVRAGRRARGLALAGLHTNGYSLARKVLLETLGHSVSTTPRARRDGRRGAPRTPPQLPRGHGAAPRAGQGQGPVPRHRRGFTATSRASCPRGSEHASSGRAWEVPPLFRLIQKGGGVSDEEMERTFNMGIGMIADRLAVRSPRGRALARAARGASFVIGSVVKGAGVSWE